MIFLKKNKYPIVLFSLIAINLLIDPYEFGQRDQSVKIAWMDSIFMPTLYLNDLAVTAMNYYVSVFSRIMIPIKEFFGVENAFAIVYMASQALLFCSIYLIAHEFTDKRLLSLFAVVLLLLPKLLPGGTVTYDTILEERTVAFSVLLFGTYLLVSARYGWAGLFYGIAANIHVVITANCLIFVLMYLIVSEFFEKRPKLFKKIGPFVVWMIIASIPLIDRKISSNVGDLMGVMDPEWVRMVLMHEPHLWDAKLFFYFYQLLIMSLFFLTFLHFDKAERKEFSKLTIATIASILALGVGLAAGIFFSKVYSLQLGMLFDLFRTARICAIVNCCIVAFCFYRLFGRNRLLSVFFLVLFSLLKMQFQFAIVSVVVVFLFLHLKIHWISSITKKMGFMMIPINSARAHHVYTILIVLVPMLLFLGFPFSMRHYDSRMKQSNIEVQKWLKEHTVKGDVILTPPHEGDFRIFSKRAIVGSWGDWGYGILNKKYATDMFARLKDLCGFELGSCSGKSCRAICKDHYEDLRGHQVKDIAAKYNARYTVMPASNPLSLEEIYRNEDYIVYANSRWHTG